MSIKMLYGFNYLSHLCKGPTVNIDDSSCTHTNFYKMQKTDLSVLYLT